ncbi:MULTISPECIES: DUF4328 domain-containing protein [unclassified Streptomyces]|uniref:DUF4328 domain-containing protein n=1 Tax=unclassified Streptomyces TaxID=2593676 RepID=UPI001660E43F|nr:MULTISPECIES: DUF4328 domain-containing protein [unclassified Streptomyces]MBD0710938.1 hypothetical protein [Streptomyces sp. CBMA291]MBD0717473.1 hypothetical protein [Streptomyces sp. CBMA370]
MLRNPNGLSYAVVSLLGVTAVVDTLSLIGDLDLRSRLVDIQEDPAALVSDSTTALTLAWSAQFLLFLATTVVFIVWFHRLRLNAEVWAGDLMSRTPGWAIGGWFVPLANFWIPRAVAADIWRASRPDPSAPDGPRELTLLNGWWVCFACHLALNRIGSGQFDRSVGAGELVDATSWLVAGDAAGIVAAGLAILLVRRLTSMQHAKATGMIPAAR